MDIEEMCNREELLTIHLRRSCPDYVDAIRVVAYWVALAIESSPIPDISWSQFQLQVTTFRKKIRECIILENQKEGN